MIPWTFKQLVFSLFLLSSSAVHIPLIQTKRSPLERRRGGSFVAVANAGNDIGLSTVDDLIYTANVTVGGIDYPVQLDTGSSDLWIQSDTNPNSHLPNANQTSMTYNLTYGIGWAYGHVAYAPVVFAGISVANQALLDVSSSLNPALSYGADGVLGLGFTSLSTIDHVVNASGGSGGRSLLYNLFQDNPSEPNFVAFSLQRSTESDDTVHGNFSIGEYDPTYAAVANNTAIPTWPVNSPKRWNVLLDALILPDQTITPSTQIPDVPGNRAVALLDSGTSYTYAPTDICNAIYGGVPGAQYDATLGQWRVPCDAEIDLALQFGDQVFPVHPLDVSPANPIDPSSCLGSFVPQTISIGAGEFDWLIGDNFLRSVYSIYDFGDFDSSGAMGNPYIKLLSLVDPNEASVEFHHARGGTPKQNITYNAANSSSSTPDTTSVTLSSEVAETLDKIGKYFPAMLGVMAFNALILMILVAVGIFFLCKGRTRKSRIPRGRKSPMPRRRASDVESLRPPQPHAYQPVSMAMTEETMFTPPSPGFHKFGSDGARKSAIYRGSVAMGEDAPFVPPSPIRAGDRPSSSVYRNSMVVPEDTPFTPPSPIQSEGRPQSFAQHPEDEVLVPPSPSYHSFDGAIVRSGDRPPSVVSQNMSIAPAEETIFMPPRAIRPGSRPQSVASQRSQRSQQIGIALTDEPVSAPPPRTLHAFQNNNLRPGDRPQSFANPPATAPPQDYMLSPPSPGFHSFDRSGDRPRSVA